MQGMSIAVSGTEFTDTDGVDGLIEMARSAQCDAVEFWYPKNALRDGVDAALRKLDRAGLRTACVSTPSQLYGTGEADSVALLHEAIALAARTGSNRVNTYFGHAPLVDDERAIEAYAGALAPVLDLAATENVVIVLENEFDAFGWDPAGSDISRRPAALAALFARVDSPWFGLNFDAANFLCAAVSAARDALPLLLPWVRYAHVKDVRRASVAETPRDGWIRYTDHGRAYDTAPLGTGELDWPELIGSLATAGYDGHLTLEPHCVPSILLTETARAAAYLREMIKVHAPSHR
ncbi:sugar phosphate isomerase/epimerase family protein [Streptomyces sp. NBC_00829]|uniref:sugar phosphate isomerase/epimerase family protein n=1 Tax=Streptomyces sp. NBC_00829 TaxID=2903679 RepID=UPI00386E969A|nr:sugar phosphate isomerase/epimerase [Streptomyces sp. NBC_00829]